MVPQSRGLADHLRDVLGDDMKMPEPSVDIAAIRKLYHQAAAEQMKRR
jgi:hypothetical protein